MIPPLPDCLPGRGNTFSRTLSRWLLAAGGWRIEGGIPARPKMVAIVAPHTSNWDFIVGVLAMFAIGIRVRFLGKHTLFNPWLGWLMRCIAESSSCGSLLPAGNESPCIVMHCPPVQRTA